MDRLSEFPEELLLRILSLLPAQDVVATMVLSKRWQFLWTRVPRLEYDESYKKIEYGRFSRLVDRSLLLHVAPVLETLYLKLVGESSVKDIGLWTRSVTQAKSCVRELIIEINTASSFNPRCLYTGCRMLVTLKLSNVIIVDDVSSSISFPSLKTLSLVSVKYPGDEFVKRFLSSCHVLEDLRVTQCPDDNVTIFNARVPSLYYLWVSALENTGWNDALGFVIDCPSLKELDIWDQTADRFYVIENDMPHIVEASIDTTYRHPWKMMRSITSVQRLFLCITTSWDAYPIGTIFCNLLHFEIGTCETAWLNLLVRVLKDSPKLRTLKLYDQCHDQPIQKLRPCWKEPSSIPKCLVVSLEILEWAGYEGSIEKEELVAFILRSGSCLKKVTISSKTTDPNKKLEMIKRLSLSFRRSSTCALVFD